MSALVIGILAGCSQANAPVERVEKGAGAENPLSAPKPEPKQCSDYYSPQQIFALEAQGKLTEADIKSLDPDGNAIYCDEPQNKLKPENAASNPQVPPYQLLESPADIPGVKGVNLTVDTASRWPNELELIGADLVAQYGEEYELIYAVFRTPPKYELHDVGFYIENERVADAWNAEMQRRGKEWGLLLLYKPGIQYGTFQLMGFSFGASPPAIPEE
jgi:hypothetical protein